MSGKLHGEEYNVLSGKIHLEEVFSLDLDQLDYFSQDDEKKWRIQIIKEIFDLELLGFDSDELNDMLDHLCTS